MILGVCANCNILITTKIAKDISRQWWASDYGDKNSAIFFRCICSEKNCLIAKNTKKLKFNKRIK